MKPEIMTGTMAMRRVKHLHFVGIGGAGMNGIAEVVLNLGYSVSGSDKKANPATHRLSAMGAKIYFGHAEANLEGADAIVISTAISEDNVEVQTAKRMRLPIVPRAEMLAELMRFRYGIAVAGTHGKTTTTSLVASLLAEGELDPTFVIGGKLNSAGANARLGESAYLVAEADESDASFLYLQPMIAVVTNIDADHMETYGGSFERLSNTFEEFLHHLPFYGLAVMCIDDEETSKLAEKLPRPVLTYGLSEKADVRAENITQDGMLTTFEVVMSATDTRFDVQFSMPGIHNVQNALAAIAIAIELNVDTTAIQSALRNFEGIGRRFQVHGCNLARAKDVLLIDDYAHHPSELQATIDAIRAGWPERRLLMVFQPHRFSRTHEQFEDFVRVLSQVDRLVLAEVFSAGETPIEGADGRALMSAIRARGQVIPVFVDSLTEIPDVLAGLIEDKDIVLVAGAGDIGTIASSLPEALCIAN